MPSSPCRVSRLLPGPTPSPPLPLPISPPLLRTTQVRSCSRTPLSLSFTNNHWWGLISICCLRPIQQKLHSANSSPCEDLVSFGSVHVKEKYSSRPLSRALSLSPLFFSLTRYFVKPFFYFLKKFPPRPAFLRADPFHYRRSFPDCDATCNVRVLSEFLDPPCPVAVAKRPIVIPNTGAADLCDSRPDPSKRTSPKRDAERTLPVIRVCH